jgi:YggT family protein
MELIEFIINVYMLAFGLRLFMPSASSFSEHPIQRGLYASTEPVLRPIRQMMIRGEPRFDWSPLIAIVFLVIIRGFLMAFISGAPAVEGIIFSLMQVFGFLVNALTILFLGIFFISIESPFGFSTVGHMMYMVADIFLGPIRRYTGRGTGRPDPSPLIGIILLSVIYGLIIYQADIYLNDDATAAVSQVILFSFISQIDFIFDVLFIVILVRTLLSFFQPDPGSPPFQLLILYSDPILAPIRRIMPSTGGLDFSPLIAIFILRFIQSSILPLLQRL